MMLIDIALLTWNRIELTRKCIDSILKYTTVPFNLMVADNNSTDGTREYLLDLYRSKKIHRLLLFDRNTGVACATNSLWELSQSDYFFKLDNDIEIKRPGWASEMSGIIQRNPEVDITAFSFLKQFQNRDFPLITLSGGDTVQDTRFFGGGCFMIPKKTHRKLGYFCEDYGLYGEEDDDYSHRAQESNLKICFLRDSDWMVHNYHKSDSTHNAKIYRLFKNSRRSANKAKEGAFINNLLMYTLKLRPLYMRRKFRTIIADDGISARIELDRAYLKNEGRKISRLKRFLKKRPGFFDSQIDGQKLYFEFNRKAI